MIPFNIRVYIFSQAYHKHLSQKSGTTDNDEKLLPIEALGKIMAAHGQEFGPESAYGACSF
jgi:hypothetical protein